LNARIIQKGFGKERIILIAIEDITERKRAQEKVRDSEERFRMVFENVFDGISIYNEDPDPSKRRLIECNERYAIQAGRSRDDLLQLGSTLGLQITLEDKANIYRLKSINKGTAYQGYFSWIRPDGKENVIEYVGMPITWRGQSYSIGIDRDITERNNIEKTLIKAKEKAESANQLKNAFIANISHEIRTPLNGIMGMANLIRDIFPGKIKEEDEELFEGIDISSKRIIRTVDMILNYSRLQVGEFKIRRKNIELSRICDNLIKEFTGQAKFKALELTFQNNCGDAVIFADEYTITIAISNLIDNAIKYTNRGFINVILYKSNNDEIILEVKDSGIGISKEYLDKLFEPYQQEQMGYGRAYEGIGLGLSLINKILILNNAAIFVESKKGEGSEFSINFGKGVHTNENMTEADILINFPVAPVISKIKAVLIIEDDTINQLTIKRFIGNNYNVIITDSSDGVLEILKKNKVDIILMDISVKGKKNGLELTKELKASKEFSYIPVIAVIAHAFEEDKQDALKAGCDSFLAKPFTKGSLLEMISVFADK
jgi:PAS domain S-box-containing protein